MLAFFSDRISSYLCLLFVSSTKILLIRAFRDDLEQKGTDDQVSINVIKLACG
jgi:hypothetical protein